MRPEDYPITITHYRAGRTRHLQAISGLRSTIAALDDLRREVRVAFSVTHYQAEIRRLQSSMAFMRQQPVVAEREFA
jgi:hypothetical protein